MIPSQKQIKQREANVKRTTTTLIKILNEQKRLGNIKKQDLFTINNYDNLKKYVQNVYNDADIYQIKNKAKEAAKQFTRTGTIISEGISKRTGKSYLKVGREVKNLYKQLKQKLKDDNKNELIIEREEIAGYDENTKSRIFQKRKYKFQDPKTMADLINQFNSPAAVIALRIDMGNPREEVLADYGY